jgi:hypothetical protein
MGIEPTYSAWEADVLPLNYTRGECRFYDASGDLGSPSDNRAGDGNVPVSRCIRDPGIPPSHVKWLGGTAAHLEVIGVQPDVPRTSGCRTHVFSLGS